MQVVKPWDALNPTVIARRDALSAIRITRFELTLCQKKTRRRHERPGWQPREYAQNAQRGFLFPKHSLLCKPSKAKPPVREVVKSVRVYNKAEMLLSLLQYAAVRFQAKVATHLHTKRRFFPPMKIARIAKSFTAPPEPSEGDA